MRKDIRHNSFTFGCEALGGTDCGRVDFEEIESAVELFIELGMTDFDTAGVYGLGLSEERLGKILGRHKDKQLQVSTKCGLTWERTKGRAIIKKDSTPRTVEKQLMESLKRLRQEVLDVFYIHWPDQSVRLQDTFEVLEHFKQKGVIKAVGFSNCSLKQLKDACTVADVRYVQLPWNILDGGPGSEMRDFIEDKEIEIVCYNALASGILAGKMSSGTRFDINDRRSRLKAYSSEEFGDRLARVEEVRGQADRMGRQLIHYVLDSLLVEGSIRSVIVGMKSRKQVKEILNGYNIIRRK